MAYYLNIVFKDGEIVEVHGAVNIEETLSDLIVFMPSGERTRIPLGGNVKYYDVREVIDNDA